MTRPPCTCRPGHRCTPCRQRHHAVGLLMRVAPDHRDDPITYADRATSAADARAALCLAIGVPVERIDPASGCGVMRG
jgi:hypothetical protein